VFLDIAPSEFLLTAVVAVVVIGPKDLPRAMRTMGRWMGAVRRVSGHFRSGIETMIREAEMEEMEKKWREQNAAIMKAHPPALDAPPVPEVAAHAPSAPLAEGELPVDTHSASAQEAAHHEAGAVTPAASQRV
jgi:sec-independent protein translocase protein TatB